MFIKHLRIIADEYLRNAKSLRHIDRLLEGNTPIYLEVGAGDTKGQDGWLTIDITDNCDIYWDLRKGIPFPDACVSKIYSSHFLEHMTYREAQQFLKECLRVLLPGGEFSICVPNAKIYIEAYCQGKTLDPDLFFRYRPAFNNTTAIDYINHIAYMDGQHKYMFDEDNLLCVLRQGGFRDVKPRQFNPMRDLSSRAHNSIYADAKK